MPKHTFHWLTISFSASNDVGFMEVLFNHGTGRRAFSSRSSQNSQQRVDEPPAIHMHMQPTRWDMLGAFPVMLRGNAIAMKTLQCQAPFCTRLFSGKFLIPSNDQTWQWKMFPFTIDFSCTVKPPSFRVFPARKMTISPGPSRWDACLEHLQSPRAASDASKLSRCELFGGTLLKMVGPWGSSSQVFPTFPNHEAVNVQVSSCKGRSEVHPVRHQA